MNRKISFIFTCLIFIFISCKNKDENVLQQHLRAEYNQPEKLTDLSSGSKAQYVAMEKNINTTYAKELDSLINTAFERQLEKFEDEQLGVLSGYKNMFTWLFSSKQSWDDKINVISNKYFNTLDIQQEQYNLYLNYIAKINNLRQQFIASKGLPSYTQTEVPSEQISLNSFSEHSRNNLAIEFGTELFEWFLGFIILQIILLFVDKITGPWGCLIDIIVFIVITIISVIMTSFNDSKLIDSLKAQHESITIGHKDLVKSLNANTIHFYESL